MMTATTVDLPPALDAIMARAIRRTPVAAQAEFAAIVARRLARLDRPLTESRLHSIIGGAWAGLGVRPRW